jgi:hypothetical protein
MVVWSLWNRLSNSYVPKRLRRLSAEETARVLFSLEVCHERLFARGNGVCRFSQGYSTKSRYQYKLGILLHTRMPPLTPWCLHKSVTAFVSAADHVCRDESSFSLTSASSCSTSFGTM